VHFHKVVKMGQNRFDSLFVAGHNTYTASSRPTPRDQHELRSFLGLCTCCRLRRHRKRKGSELFNGRRKRAPCTAPVTSCRQPAKKFTIDTEASNVGISVVVSQVQGGQEQVMAYYSKTPTTADRNYCIT
jgi:hypothetical protein